MIFSALHQAARENLRRREDETKAAAVAKFFEPHPRVQKRFSNAADDADANKCESRDGQAILNRSIFAPP
jgi:hypothetical protein